MNIIHGNRDIIKSNHYITKTKFKNYWFNYYPSTLQKYKERFAEKFYLIIAGQVGEDFDFYCIPFSALSEALVSETLQEKQKRWIGTIDNHMLNLQKYDKRIDLSAYYGTDVNSWLSEFIQPKTPPITQTDGEYLEGSLLRISEDRHERNRAARDACIKHHGCSCAACGFNFEDKYGILARGFIHVHHLSPISGLDQERQIDPIKDLIPLCPNCHSVVHLQRDPISIKRLKELLDRPSGSGY